MRIRVAQVKYLTTLIELFPDGPPAPRLGKAVTYTNLSLAKEANNSSSQWGMLMAATMVRVFKEAILEADRLGIRGTRGEGTGRMAVWEVQALFSDRRGSRSRGDRPAAK